MSLPSAITTFTKLTSLVVESNYLKQLPDRIGNLTRLRYFSCARNRIKRIPRSISKLRKLRSLVAYQNRLGDRGFPDTICDMDGLKELRLSHNYISRLPYRFSSSPLMKSLKVLWLYGNQFFDIGDLALRLGSIKDFRIDQNPMVNPPPRYVSGQIKSLVEYTSLRIFRIRDIQARCRAEGWTVDATQLVPVACRDGHFVTGGYGTLTSDELSRVDEFVEKYVNGDIATFTKSPKPLIDELVYIHKRRRFKYIRGVYMEFQKFLKFCFDYVRGVNGCCCCCYCLCRCVLDLTFLCLPARTSFRMSTSAPVWCGRGAAEAKTWSATALTWTACTCRPAFALRYWIFSAGRTSLGFPRCAATRHRRNSNPKKQAR